MTYFSTEPDYDIEWCYSQCRAIARGIIASWPDLEADEEDLVQITTITATRCASKGLRITRRFLRRLASASISKLLGEKRYNGRRTVRDNEVPWVEWNGASVPAQPELGPLALWRLQRIYPTLSEIQKRALGCLVTDGSWIELERQHGTTAANHQRALYEVVKKLNGEKACGKGNGAFRFGGNVLSGRSTPRGEH